MANRVLPFGFGKCFIRIRLDELPKDIQEGLIELEKNWRDDDSKITEDTEEIIILGEVVSYLKGEN